MAKPRKLTLGDLDFSSPDKAPSWARALRGKRINAEAEADAAIKSLLESGEVSSISEEQRQDMIDQIMQTGDFEFTEPVAQEETTPVLPSTEPQEQDGVGGFLLRAGLYPGYTLTKEHADYANTVRRSADIQEELDQLTVEEHGVGLFGRLMSMPAGAPGVGGLAIKPIQQTKEQLAKQQADIAARKLELKEQRNILQVEAESIEERLGGRGEAGSRVSRALGGIAAQPEQALPLVGGIAGSAIGGVPGAVVGAGAGSLPMVDTAYNAAFSEAINEFGANKEEALAYAGVMTGIEFGTEALGGALGGAYSTGLKMFGLKKPGKELLKKALVSKVRSRIARGAGAALAEGGEEVAAELGGDVVREVMEAGDLLSSEDARSRLKKYNAERTVDRFDRMLDAGIAGVLIGGPIGSVTGAYQYGAEIAKKEQGTIDAADRRLELEKLSARKPDDELNQDIAREEERLRTEQAKEDAFRQAEEDRARQEQEAARQKEIEEEAGQRTIELERQFQGQTRVDRAPGITERVPINPPAEITPEQVEQERVAEEQAAVDAARQKEQAGLLDEIQKRQKAKQRGQGRTKRLEEEKTKKAEAARRKAILDQLVEENPDADPAQLLPLYQQRLAATETTAPPTEQRVITPEMKSALKALKVPSSVIDKMSYDSAVKRLGNTVPAATPAATTTEQPATPVTPPVSGQVTNDQEIADMRKGFGLNMETTTPPATPEESKAKRRRVLSGLSRANVNKTVDVENLIRQGKMVVAANPEEIGRSDSGVGTYDSATGTMYLYTDRVDENNLVNSALQAALHEPVHAGQFNEREARSQVMQTLMSPESNSRVNQTIRNAARNGNTIAQAVVEDARKAAESNPDFMGDVESLELAPYLATRVEQARGKPLGQVGGAVRDVLSNARNFLRERTGLDLDITIGDLATATQQAAGEIVNTELTPEGEGTLEMIGGRNARGFDRAREAGQTFTEEADGRERFEIPDYKAELADPLEDDGENTYDLLLNGQPIQLGQFLNHPTLYDNYPTLRGLKLQVKPLDVYAQYNGRSRSITLSRNQVVNALETGNSEFLRKLVLHEVQHAVQDIEGFASGANKKAFMPSGIVNSFNQAEAARQKAIEQFDVNRAISELPFETKKMWDAYANWAGYTTVKDMAVGFMTNREFINNVKSPILKQRAEIYYNATENYNAAVAKYNETESKAFKKYLSDLGEAEARNTEQRSRMTPEEIMASPARDTLLQDPLSRDHNLTRADLIDSNAMRRAGRNMSDSSSLNMAATNPVPTRTQVPTAVRSVFNLFDHALGVGKDFNELIEFASSSPAEARMIAERSLHTYNDTLAKEATKRGMSPAELNEQIQKELDAAVKETSGYNENYAAFKSVTDKYGKPGQAMLDMRNQIDALTKDIIQARLSKGTPLSAKEKKLYETLINNLGRYTHRQYATNAGKIGDKFSKMVWDDYQKVKEAGGQGKAKQLANYKRVANAVKYLVDNNLYIPDAEGLSDMTAQQTEQLYDVWGVQGNPRNLNTEQMKAALADARDRINGDTNRMEAVAEEITKELIGLGSDDPKALTTYFRGGKQENTILRERQNIPVELRELMGEIKDPAMRMMLTVAKQAEFVARNKMLLEIADNVGSQVQPPDAIGTPEVQGLEQLRGEGWGPLEGYYVSKELKNRLNDAILQLANFEQAVAMAGTDTSMLTKVATNKVVEGWGKVAGTTKALQIIGKPVNFLYNYLGAYRQLVMNGNIDLRTWGKAHLAAIELIAYAKNPVTAGPLAIEANKYGITDSAFIGELRSGQYKELQKLVKEMAGMSPSKAMAKVAGAVTFSKELYAMMDVWSKMANFYHEVDVLTNYYKAAGVNKTTEQIKREAADRANRTNITYKRAAPLVKGLEKMGITAFGTYFYEVFRSEIGNAYQGVQDLRTAAKAPNAKAKSIMAGHAVSRLTGQAASWALTGYISKALAEVAFGDEDDDQDKRYLLPEYLRNKDFISLGRNENGEAVLFDWSRIDPAGPMTDIMRSIMHDDADLNAIADNFMQLYVAPRVGSQLINAVWASLDPEKKARGNPFIKQTAPEVYKEITDIIPGEDRTDKAWVNVVETFLPGIVSGYKDSNVVPVPEDLTSVVADSMTYGGATMYKLDPRRQAQSAVIEYDTAKRLARRDFGDLLKDYPEGLSQAELADKLGSAMQRERETFTDLVNVTKGMRAIGMTGREISVMLKDLRLDAGDIPKVKKQQFESAAMTGDTIKTKMKQEMIGKTPKEQEEIKEKWDNIRLMIEGKN